MDGNFPGRSVRSAPYYVLWRGEILVWWYMRWEPQWWFIWAWQPWLDWSLGLTRPASLLREHRSLCTVQQVQVHRWQVECKVCIANIQLLKNNCTAHSLNCSRWTGGMPSIHCRRWTGDRWMGFHKYVTLCSKGKVSEILVQYASTHPCGCKYLFHKNIY